MVGVDIGGNILTVTAFAASSILVAVSGIPQEVRGMMQNIRIEY